MHRGGGGGGNNDDDYDDVDDGGVGDDGNTNSSLEVSPSESPACRALEDREGRERTRWNERREETERKRR